MVAGLHSSPIRHDAECFGFADDAAEAGGLEACDDAGGHALAELACWVADVVKELAARTNDTMKLAVEVFGVEVASQTESGRIVEDAGEGTVGEVVDLFGGVTKQHGDLGVVEERVRPGIEAGNLQRCGV